MLVNHDSEPVRSDASAGSSAATRRVRSPVPAASEQSDAPASASACASAATRAPSDVCDLGR